jgi:hypothetical protein
MLNYMCRLLNGHNLGEITERSQGSLDSHCLKYSDVVVQQNHMLISFQSYKHSIPGKVCKILINRQLNSSFCPVRHLLLFFEVRGTRRGKLFCHLNGSPILRSQFIDMLNHSLTFIGLSPAQYKGHSFRIGGSHLGSSEWKIGFTNSQYGSLAFKCFFKIP